MARKKQSRPKRAGLGVARVPLKKKKWTFKQWTRDEHERFVTAFTLYPRKWTKIAEYVGTKTAAQVCSHATNYFKQLEREGKGHLIPPPGKRAGAGNAWTPEEHKRFLDGLTTHGRHWSEVTKVVRTKTSKQVTSHAYYYFKQLEREGKGHLIPPPGKLGRPRKNCTEEAHQQQQEPTLTSASASSGTICTTGDHDDSTGGIESTPSASIFEEETSGGSSVEEVCEDAAAPTLPAVGTEGLDLDASERQLCEDLLHIVQSQRKRQ